MGGKVKIKEAEAVAQRKAEVSGGPAGAPRTGELRAPPFQQRLNRWLGLSHLLPKSGAGRVVQAGERREAGAGEQLQVWACGRGAAGGGRHGEPEPDGESYGNYEN